MPTRFGDPCHGQYLQWMGTPHEDHAMKKNVRIASIVLVAMAAAGISLGLASSVSRDTPKEATPITQAMHDNVGKQLPFEDTHLANLYPLPPEEAAKKYVEFMGGASPVIEKATAAYQRGEYRWVAEVMKHVVFADPSNERARSLQADAMAQLGYQAESAAWRNEFLIGAYELRNGPPKSTGVRNASPDALRAMTVEMLLDYMGILIDGPKAEGQTIILNLRLTDIGEHYALTLENAVLTYTANKQVPGADATLALPKAALVDVLLGRTTLGKEIEHGRASVEGSRPRIDDLLALLVTFDPMFNIVTP
jgi:alkyl sulfatase BDS1-like metallo-beta-lactamase superfamily hydrolase